MIGYHSTSQPVYKLYVDHTQPPFIDIALPKAIILPHYQLFILYSLVIGLDFFLLINERSLPITSRQLRIAMAVYHIIIPMIFISPHPASNVMWAATPWFLASYSAHMPADQLTLETWIHSLFKITIKPSDEAIKSPQQIRFKGIARFSLGLFKIAFMHMLIDPLLPRHAEYALEYSPFSIMSMVYTVLYGIKAYCLLGLVDCFMGIEQALFGWDMVELFHSPIISYSPRDFWSRRWNRVVRNLLHSQVFTRQKKTELKEDDYDKKQINDEEEEDDMADFIHGTNLVCVETVEKKTVEVEKETAPKKKRGRPRKNAASTATSATTIKRVTRKSAAANDAIRKTTHPIVTITLEDDTTPFQTDDDEDTTVTHKQPQVIQHDITVAQKPRAFWSTQKGRGLLAFIVSGVFHELIIMSACRRITLENLFFFTLQGISVMIEVELRKGAWKTEPRRKTRILCIALQLIFMSITGRLFTGPFLRYNFFPSSSF